MEACTSQAEIEREWDTFVDLLDLSFKSFQNGGIKLSPKFQPWAGIFVSQRKKDPLLFYLQKSRNIAQHGHIVLMWTTSNQPESEFALIDVIPPTLRDKRAKTRIEPPTSHMRKDIEACNPITLAKLGVEFYESVIREGEEKFVSE